MSEHEASEPERPPKEAYETRIIRRSALSVEYYVRVLRDQIGEREEAWWLLRRWREDGAGRPLVLALAGEGKLRWVVRSQADGANRWRTDRYPSVTAYQLNVQSGAWTETRMRYVRPRQIVEILAADDPLVRKVWAVAMRRTLGVW